MFQLFLSETVDYLSNSGKNEMFLLVTLRALSIYEKKPEISVVAKVEFPIGKKLFHLVVNPGTWNKRFRSEIPTGKTGLPF